VSRVHLEKNFVLDLFIAMPAITLFERNGLDTKTSMGPVWIAILAISMIGALGVVIAGLVWLSRWMAARQLAQRRDAMIPISAPFKYDNKRESLPTKEGLQDMLRQQDEVKEIIREQEEAREKVRRLDEVKERMQEQDEDEDEDIKEKLPESDEREESVSSYAKDKQKASILAEEEESSSSSEEDNSEDTTVATAVIS
jgi:hypothetical protein